jgi:predicted PurR-regulated permease PerM
MLGIFKSSKNDMVEFTVSNRTVIRVVALVIASFIFLAAVKQAAHTLVLIFTAFFLALALNAPVHKLAQHLPGKRRGNRTLATATAFSVVIILLAAFLASIVPPLVRQTTNFIDQAPQMVSDARNGNSNLGRFIQRYHLEEQAEKTSSQLSDRLRNASGTAVSTVSRVTTSVFAMLTVLVLTFMMLVEGPYWLKFALRLMPEERRDHASEIAADMYRVVKGYVNGQVLLAAIASVFVLVGLLVLRVSYPIALMVIVFICGLIPLVGHTIGAVVVTAVALFTSPVSAVIILAYYILYQQIENYVIQPKVQANSTNMSPLLVFSSVIVGVNFGGLLGGLVAIPVAGCFRILLLDYLEEHHILSSGEVDKATTHPHAKS